MATFLLVLHIFTCLILVLVVLVQSGKEGGLGMMGGGAGSSQSVFGSSGGADFFTKMTSALAAVFMVTSVFLSVVKGGKHTSVFAAPGAAPTTKTVPLTPSQAIPSETPMSKPGSGSTTTAPGAATQSPSAPAAPSKAPGTATPKKK